MIKLISSPKFMVIEGSSPETVPFISVLESV
jgi:hypothetical protein